ncbi:MAG: hypothetical protein ACOC9H_01915, partial [Gemmatimonadota bacterium]
MSRCSMLTDVRVGILALTALAAFVLTSCGGDAPAGPEEEISAEQAERVALAVSEAAGQATGIALAEGQSAAGSLAPSPVLARSVQPKTQQAPGQFTWDFDSNADCPEGGTVGAAGSGSLESSDEGGTISFDWTAGVSYDECGVETDDGVFFLSTASPFDLDGSGQAVNDGEGSLEGSFDWSYAGSVAWDELDGPSGTCSIDLTASLDFQGGASSATWGGTVAGTVCGQDVD